MADLRYRYAGSGLGVLWNVLTPLAMLALYAVIFGNAFAQRAGSPTASVGAFVFYLASGFLPWGAFADGVARTTNSLVSNSTYLRRMPIPEQVFVAQASLSAMLSMFIVLGLLFGLAIVMGRPVPLTWLLMPIVAVLWQALAFGVGLVLATVNVFLRDVSHLVGVILQIWMWSLPVVYLEEVLPSAYRSVLEFNPAYPFLRTLRDAYLGSLVVDPWMWGAMLAWAAASICLGFFILNMLRSEIRDVL